MKISIITVTYNSTATIAMCIASVQKQSYHNIEHIIIDGASKDNTVTIINSMPNRVTKIISEPDLGIYDAMNKGINLASGEIIGILNSDDFFTSEDVVNGDVCFVNPGNLKKVVRYYSSKMFKPSLFRFGFMPAHPGFYVRRKCYIRNFISYFLS